MRTFFLFRALAAIPLLLGASLLIFLVFAFTPGDFIDGNINLTAQRAVELKSLYGLDQPWWLRYLHWLAQLLHGNLGFSMQYQIPVTELLGQYLFNSFLLASVSMVLYWGIALVTGVLAAVRPYSLFDRLLTLVVFAAMSFPVFFLCLLLIKWVAVDLGWLPVGGMVATGSDTKGWAYVHEVAMHMVLPVITLVMLQAGGLTRYFRASMFEALAMDFVRTARAKGLKA